MKPRTAAFSLFSMLMLVSNASAGSFGGEIEEKISQSILKIKTQKDNPGLLEKAITIFESKQNCGKKNNSSEPWCPISECDVSPESCRTNRTLVFRGEDHFFDYPATSELWRTIKNGSSFGDGLSVFQIIQKLDFLRQEVIEWNKRDNPQYVLTSNYRQFFFGEHSEPNEMPFEDPVLKKTVYLDPLISFTLSPKRAKGFALKDDQGGYAKVIALSIPNENIKSLCDEKPPSAGEIIQSFDCSNALNEYSYENEVDAFLMVDPDYIWKVFTK